MQLYAIIKHEKVLMQREEEAALCTDTLPAFSNLLKSFRLDVWCWQCPGEKGKEGAEKIIAEMCI